MSLVEKALRKLQESRSTPPAPAAPIPTSAAQVVYQPPPPNVHAYQPQVPAQTPSSVTPGPPKRVVVVDKNALRAMELMPPAPFERAIASQYQHIKRPLVAAALGKSATPVPNGHLLMMASALPGEGKTFTSINLALSMALEKDIQVLLVDADVLKPHLTRIFGMQEEPGLMDLLGDSNLHPDSVILPTDIPGLSLLPAGRQVPNGTELLASSRMEQIVTQLGARGSRRIVLFDSPPLLLSTESRAIVAVVGQVLLVVRAEYTSRAAVADAIGLIGDTKPVNMILNQSEAPASAGYYGYGSYGDTAAKALQNASADGADE